MEVLAVLVVVGVMIFGVYKLKQKIQAKKDAKHIKRVERELEKLNNKK